MHKRRPCTLYSRSRRSRPLSKQCRATMVSRETLSTPRNKTVAFTRSERRLLKFSEQSGRYGGRCHGDRPAAALHVQRETLNCITHSARKHLRLILL
ncbi:hypothetical protein EVAR_25657_1 [Eumeta japonica]|uniref:Uncharacterized protein n=1 Tax=Eumeta variegata TaxID=151549 RepID=A0A4C1WH23_EUMVA|nr:hypothetical protein EVAR_25657_1 [Eumeta japonica]